MSSPNRRSAADDRPGAVGRPSAAGDAGPADAAERATRTPALTRGLALVGGLVLTGSYVGVLATVTGVVGGTVRLAAAVAGALVLATVLALGVRPAVAAAISAGLLVAGAVGYLQAAPLGWQLLADLQGVVLDTIALSTGVSVLRMRAAGAWAIGFAPAPVFLSWYLFVRHRYAAGAAVGGTALLWFVLTGDAGTTTALLGAIAAAAVLGAGELEHRGVSLADAELLALVLAAMVVATTTVSLVPATGGAAFLPGGKAPTVEGGVVRAGDRLSVVGSVSLSPKVRFVVEADRPAYWRVGAYDRYTGQGWVRTGSPRPYDEAYLGRGSGRKLVQEVTVRSKLSVVPAAWRPQSVEGDAEDVARVSSLGGLAAAGTLDPGDRYTVVSRRPHPSEAALRRASDDYPDAIEERYTQLPATSPDRLERFTDRLADGADSPYQVVTRVERWLETNKGYSLSVNRPEEDIAASFVFDMSAGYCTYFATAMVAMLRTQGIPARLAVGYTTGQQVDPGRWVVRGYNAHAWVEVYFPDVGWVRFDPTPAGPRRQAQRGRLAEARQNDVEGVDTDESDEESYTPTATETPTPGPTEDSPTSRPNDNGTLSSPDRTPRGAGVGKITPTGSAGTGTGGWNVPSREVFALGVVVLAGLAAGVRRSDGLARVRRLATAYWQRRSGDPDADVRRAVERLEYVLGQEYRPRRTGESRGRYLAVVAGLERDDRLRRVGQVYQRAVYGGGVDADTAAEAVALVDAVAREHLPPRSGG